MRRAAVRLAGRIGGQADHHNFRLTHAQLLDLIATMEFSFTGEHWQKSPDTSVVYVAARKRAEDCGAQTRVKPSDRDQADMRRNGA